MADDGDTCGQIEPDWKKRYKTKSYFNIIFLLI